MKKIISCLIVIMMIFTMLPYTAAAAENNQQDAEIITKDIVIGQPEEITVYYFENKDVTVESEDTSIAYGMVTNSSMIISSGSVLYGKTIKITPSRIGSVNLIIRANGEVDKIYTINVEPVYAEENIHIGDHSVFEFISLYNEVITFTETQGLDMNVLSKTQRVSTMTVNGIAVTEVSYVYKIQVDYEQPGDYEYSFSGEQSGEVWHVNAAVSNHSWETGPAVDKEPTCIEEGSESVHCMECDAVKDEAAIPVIEHSFKWVVDQAATEQAPGSMHEECTECGTVRNEDTVIEQLTHTHELVKTEAVEAACITAGNIEYYTCLTCGSLYSDKTATETLREQETIVVPAGHTVAIRPAVAATCTEEGATEEAYCTVCEEILVPHKIILAKGHRFSTSWSYDADCHWYECECGLRQNESVHEFTWIIDKEPTEQETGIKHEECSVCHAVRNKNTNIDKLMHVPDLVKVGAVEATCTTAGHIEYYHCRSCGNMYSDETTNHLITRADTIVKAKGHNYSEWMTISKSTCVRKGYEFTSCKDCGIAEIRELPLKEHKFKHIRKEPTCITAGATITKCETCDMQISDEIPATGHKTVAIESEPTCTEDGKTGGIECSVCKAVLKQPETVPMTGHTFGKWITEKEATCTDAGEEYRVCSSCKYVDTAIIPRLDHTVEVIPAVAATCTSTGLTEGIFCTSCSNILKAQETVAKLAHNWNDEYSVDKKSTVNGTGSMSHHCADCNVISKASVMKINKIKKITAASLVYNGSNRTPLVTVTDTAGKKLKKGTDFTVTFKNHAGTKTVKPKNVGKYKAVITFKGKYGGSVTRTFKISPKGTAITGLTKGKKQFTVKWKKKTGQVTGYQIRYSTKQNMSDAKSVLVKSYKTTNKTVKNLKAKKKYWVKIRTYKTVNGAKYYSAWSKKRYVVTK